MKKIFLLLFVLICYGRIFSQNYVDLAKFHYAITPENSFDTLSGNTNIEEFGADLTFPIKLNENKVIISGIAYEKIKTKLHPLSNFTHFTSINLKVGLNKKHSERWTGTYLLLPKISSNLKNVTSKHLQLGALALLKYTKSSHLKYTTGLYFNNELFGPFLVPIFGFYYKSPNQKIETNLVLPIWADINYELKSWLNAGVNFSAFTKSYYLGNDNAYAVKISNEIFTYLQFNINKSLLLQTKLGYSIGRSYKAYQEDEKIDLGVSLFRFGDERTVLNPSFKDGLIFRLRLIYRFHLNKKG